MTAYDDLMAFQRETEALAQVAGRLGWDQETMMPRGAAEQRAEEMAAMEGVLHARRIDPRIADWLGQAVAVDEVAAAQLRLIRRSYDRATKVPGGLGAGDCPCDQHGAGHLGRGAGARGCAGVPAGAGRCDPAAAGGRRGAWRRAAMSMTR